MDGLTTPYFKAVGNVPDDSDALISSVMGLVLEPQQIISQLGLV